MDALGSGRQPSFGKRRQLIPDGINHPLRHLEEASKLTHPFDEESEVKAMRRESEMDDPVKVRTALLEKLRTWSIDPEVRKRDGELKTRAGIGFTRLGKKLHLGLMERVQKEIHIGFRPPPLMQHWAPNHGES